VRRAIPEIIKELLEEGDKSPKELLEGTKKRALEIDTSFTKQNYYYHLKKLVERGEVRKIFVHKYGLIREEAKEDRFRALEYIETIKKEGNEDVLLSRIEQLKGLCARKRVARFPDVRLSFQECLENPAVVGNSRIFGEFVSVLVQVLDIEYYRIKDGKDSDSKEIIQDVLLRTSETIISAVEENPDFPTQDLILFLGMTEKEKAVHMLFERIKNNGSVAKKRISDLTTALKNLYKKYSKLIDEYIDNLIRKGDDTVREVVTEIRAKLDLEFFE